MPEGSFETARGAPLGTGGIVSVVGSDDGTHKPALGADARPVDDGSTGAAYEGDDVSYFAWIDEAADE